MRTAIRRAVMISILALFGAGLIDDAAAMTNRDPYGCDSDLTTVCVPKEARRR